MRVWSRAVMGSLETLDPFEETKLIQSILNQPDPYLKELKQELIQATCTDVSLSTICRTLKHLGFSRNKLRHIVEQRGEERRLEFIEEIDYFYADMLVWTDESGSDQRNEMRSMDTALGGWLQSATKMSVVEMTFSCFDNSWNRRHTCDWQNC